MHKFIFIVIFQTVVLLSYPCMAQEEYTMQNTLLIKGIRYDMQKKPINGILRVYYPNGVLLLEMPYKNGLMDGIARGYRQDGKLYEEIIYRKSKEIKKIFYTSKNIIV